MLTNMERTKDRGNLSFDIFLTDVKDQVANGLLGTTMHTIRGAMDPHAGLWQKKVVSSSRSHTRTDSDYGRIL